jgi:methyl-accepting chemotaxis protein
VAGLGIVGLAIAMIILFMISGRLISPVKTLARDVSAVSRGNFDIHRNNNLPQDEIGILTQDVYNLVDVINGIMGDVAKLSREFNKKGDIEYRINAEKYQGGYREVIDSLNYFADSSVNDILSILDALGKVNKGDFDAHIEKKPGKKIVINENMDALMENLHSVYDEINAKIEAVAAGDLTSKIDVAKYDGDWHKIMRGLNRISKSVATPIMGVELSLSEMQNGNFDLADINRKMAERGLDSDVESYNGVFRNLMESVDKTTVEISAYVREISDDLRSIASGDLTTEIKREYMGDFAQIKQSLNSISQSLHKTMAGIAASSNQVLEGSKLITNSAAELANGALEQAASVQELNASIETINANTQRNAESATTANELSGKSADNALEGNNAMTQMVHAMTQIKDSSNNISKIVKTIQDIAFQTNLLALNAAVEAARAGEHGKGFSVVAEEVRTLAGRSQEAATETTALITDSITRVETGSDIAETTAVSLTAIVTSANEVLEIIGEISAASKEQADAINNISGGLEQISRVVQSNSAVSQEAASAAQELNSQAEMLQDMVKYFKL